MEQTTKEFKLIQALLKTELSVNAMVQALYKAGFNCERNVYDLSMQVMELIGFTTAARETDELLHFYVTTLDRLTEQHLLEDTENINEVVQLFYTELQTRQEPGKSRHDAEKFVCI